MNNFTFHSNKLEQGRNCQSMQIGNHSNATRHYSRSRSFIMSNASVIMSTRTIVEPCTTDIKTRVPSDKQQRDEKDYYKAKVSLMFEWNKVY